MMSFLIFLTILFTVLNFITDSQAQGSYGNYHPLPSLYNSEKEYTRSEKWFFPWNEETSAFYWRMQGQLKLRDQLLKTRNTNEAKNVIFFLGDGMSIPTLVASRIYKGQLSGKRGEESELSFETFPYTGLSKTYCVDKQVADSACSATAYLCGVKANSGTIGVTARVTFDDCESGQNTFNHVSSLATWAQKAGKGTGIVTTTRVTHASPAGTYAHVANRNYESDLDVEQTGHSSTACIDIARQLILSTPGTKFKVIMGGGRKKFLPNTEIDEDGYAGERRDGLNLINTWKKQKNGNAQYITNRKSLKNLNFDKTDYLMGLFDSDNMQYHLDADPDKQPTLAEMVEGAIKMLQNEENGYFLFVEGGRIDHGHHESKARKSLDETVEFSKAIELAMKLTSTDDTLIVVTSDHAHTMSVSGYPNRGNDILGLNTNISPIDGLPYTTISYANGPGYVSHVNGSRPNLNETDLSDKDFMYPGLVPLQSETHGGDDVGVFALGPWSHLFSGVYEQNVIPHIVAFASCTGDGLTTCLRKLNT